MLRLTRLIDSSPPLPPPTPHLTHIQSGTNYHHRLYCGALFLSLSDESETEN